MDDTIVAISTPTGQGGIGIIRLSGNKALSIAEQMFITKNKQKPSSFKSYTVHYGWVVKRNVSNNGSSQEQLIDEALLTVMRAPQSYTKEDVVEISCHGGVVSLRTILNLALDLEARLAEPGEFTKRAYLNGRIDLAQAEAVLDIIQSKTETFLKLSTNQLKGDLSIELESIREDLMNTYTEIEAIVNFPEDEVETEGKQKLAKDIDSMIQKVNKLLDSSEQGRVLREGIKVVFCGRSNVGKSSLLNVLLKMPRAIVSDIAGTTRDTIEETAQIKGIPFQIVDTAGILEPRDLIEEEAIKRSQMYLASAHLVLLILDSSEPITQEDERLMRNVQGQNVLVTLNKCDLREKIEKNRIRDMFPTEKIIQVSALKRIAIDELEGSIVENVWHGKTMDTHSLMVSNVRHIGSLKSCRDCLDKAQETLKNNFSLEFVSEEIKRSVNYLDSITGRNIDADLLENIFSQFCIGK